jgi:hypothetical protein
MDPLPASPRSPDALCQFGTAQKIINSLEILFRSLVVGASMRAMPSQIAERAEARSTEPAPLADVLSAAERAAGAKILDGPDPSIHMLGLPQSHPQLGRWVALAILTGAIVALTLIGILAR